MYYCLSTVQFNHILFFQRISNKSKYSQCNRLHHIKQHMFFFLQKTPKERHLRDDFRSAHLHTAATIQSDVALTVLAVLPGVVGQVAGS